MKVGDIVRVLAYSDTGDEVYGEVVESDCAEEFCYVLFPSNWETESPSCEKIYMFQELEVIDSEPPNDWNVTPYGEQR